jgi:predicted nuclease of predicted toxin-antitoxin system
MNEADQALTDDEIRTLFSADIRQRDDVRFYLDVNVSHLVVAHLQEEDNGLTITDAYSQEQANERSDFLILARARELGFVFVTLDRDYREIHQRLRKLGLSHAGIIFVRSETLKTDPLQLATGLARLAAKYEGSTDLLRSALFPL